MAGPHHTSTLLQKAEPHFPRVATLTPNSLDLNESELKKISYNFSYCDFFN